ncbi:MAG: DNA mismatch repair protein MutS [Clostridia bacterium]|nr:MAG: DNA mismatch repair protein MutS [Clostridia bacterium]
MLDQYQEMKKQYPEALLFFRLGDFYEMFFADAEIGARELEIVLTSREAGVGKRVPMCGIPYHAADNYLARLLRKGYRIAICEQVEDPKKAKGLVRREIVRVVSPGTTTDLAALQAKQNNYLVSLNLRREVYGLAVVDVSTGEFWPEVFPAASLDLLLDRLGCLSPAECLVGEFIGRSGDVLARLRDSLPGTLVVTRPDTDFRPELGDEVCRRFPALATGEFSGPDSGGALLGAVASLLRYLEETQKAGMVHLHLTRPQQDSRKMTLDQTTRRNLEVLAAWDGSPQGSLLELLDLTRTAMGGRLLRRWLEEPLLDLETIRQRHDCVAELVEDLALRQNLREQLRHIYDLERLIGRACCGTANARDLLACRTSLAAVPVIVNLLRESGASRLAGLVADMEVLADIRELLERAIDPEAPLSLHETGLIRSGYHPEVDHWREARQHGQEWIAALESRERERTGIKSLKIGFNKVFGYYLEVTRANLNLVPPDYVRRQTLAGAERFVTPQLKEYEELILEAEEKLADLEYELFIEVRQSVAEAAPRFQEIARRLAALDVLASLAEVASRYNYCRPVMEDSEELELKNSRHPIVERHLPEGFVPNDLYLNTSSQRLIILTGPNMAGKSTYMRQVALIVLMAQMGSFVSADYARIGLVDRIFTRIGAVDDLSRGRSTFMVEMQECQVITTQATRKSLVIMDEVGRGTSTYDGISLAWALLEYLHDLVQARTIFSTHYHELTVLEDTLPGSKNFNMAVREGEGELIFLRRVVPGRSDRSYGIQVASLAQMPESIIQRAREIMAELDGQRPATLAAGDGRAVVAAREEGEKQVAASRLVEVEEDEARKEPSGQGSLFSGKQVAREVLARLAGLELVSMTPLEAINELYRLQTQLKAGRFWVGGEGAASQNQGSRSRDGRKNSRG